MSFSNLTTDNIMIYALKAYDRPDCIMSEFKDDMKRFNYLKRLFKRYRKAAKGKHGSKIVGLTAREFNTASHLPAIVWRGDIVPVTPDG
jgi:hypothetical protein